ncbi:MAG TPA: YeeE/YedE family protein, partial [Dissulfurispiraceae bacterium]
KDNPALWDLFGSGPVVKWVTIAVFCSILLIVVAKGKPFGKAKKGYYWSTTGVLTGIIVIIAWWASSYFGGGPRGLSFTNPLKELFFTILTKSSNANDPEFNFFGLFKATWSALYVIGVPLGAYLSARGLKEFKWKVPPAGELITVFLGSLLMGFGAAVGGGCNVGHGLTGSSTLAISSIVTTIFILLGNWTMAYFRFIRPMQD